MRKKILILEAALRHDDWHSGNTYRQDVVYEWEMSNEEYAIYLLENDFRDMGLRDEDLQFIKNCILATTFGQWKLRKEDPKFRDYSPKILEEKLVVFADVWWMFLYGLDYWKAESERVYKESGVPILYDKNWLDGRKWFFTYVLSLYNEIRNILSDKLKKKINSNILEIVKYLSDEEKRLDWI